MKVQPKDISLSRYLTLLYAANNSCDKAGLAEFLGVTEAEAAAELRGMQLSGMLNKHTVPGSRRGRVAYELTPKTEHLVKNVADKLAQVA